MADVLAYDVDVLRERAAELGRAARELEAASNGLRGSLDGMRDDWDSDAGRAFFGKLDTDWTQAVAGYVALVDKLAEALDAAAREYEPLEDEFNRLALEL